MFQGFANEDVKGKTVTFIPTASIVESVKFYVGAGKKTLERLGMIVDELEISKSSTQEIKMEVYYENFTSYRYTKRLF